MDRRLLCRIKKIETLPSGQKKILFSNIDMFLKGALGEGKTKAGKETFAE